MLQFHTYNPNRSDNEQLWEFISTHNNSSVFHTLEYYLACYNTSNHTPFIYYVSDNEKICGIISGDILKNYRWPLTFLTSRAIVYGGPLLKTDDPDIFDFLLTNLIKKLEKKVIYIELRNSFELDKFKNIFEKLKFRYEKHLNIIINLNTSIDSIERSISKNKRRNVTKSKNKGCTYTEMYEKLDLYEAYGLLQMTYKRIGLPLPSREFFLNINEHLGKYDMFKCFAVKLDELIIGVRLELLYKDTMYDWYAGSNDAFRKFYPNDFLIYHTLMWARKQGLQKFDFGGAGKPGKNYGVRDHKLKFGGELTEPGRYLRINKNVLFSTGKFAVRILGLASRKK